jgi:hypothetical protein
MKAGSQMEGRTHGPREHAHEHKFQSAREHRRAHKIDRQTRERARVRQTGKRAVERSEWLTRTPADVITASGFKQPGRRFGPAVIGSGLGPMEGARPLRTVDRVLNYLNRGNRSQGADLTVRQAKRTRQKQRRNAADQAAPKIVAPA